MLAQPQCRSALQCTAMLRSPLSITARFREAVQRGRGVKGSLRQQCGVMSDRIGRE
jgi:hypothetical protein